MGNPNEVKNPVDEEWELYKKYGWKMYDDNWSTCLDCWRTASVCMPHLSRIVRWSWSCQASSCALERHFSKVGFINNCLHQGQTLGVYMEA